MISCQVENVLARFSIWEFAELSGRVTFSYEHTKAGFFTTICAANRRRRNGDLYEKVDDTLGATVESHKYIARISTPANGA